MDELQTAYDQIEYLEEDRIRFEDDMFEAECEYHQHRHVVKTVLSEFNEMRAYQSHLEDFLDRMEASLGDAITPVAAKYE